MVAEFPKVRECHSGVSRVVRWTFWHPASLERKSLWTILILRVWMKPVRSTYLCMTFWLYNWNSASEHQNICERVWWNFSCSRYRQVTPSQMFSGYCLMIVQIVILLWTVHDEVTSRACTALILLSFDASRWNPSQMVNHHYLQDCETVITEHLWWSHLFVSNNRRVMAGML